MVKQIAYNSAEYQKMVALRNKVLRFPLGLELDRQSLLKEKDDILIGYWESDDIIGTLILTTIDKNTVSVRQVAVEQNRQGQGIGRSLMEFAQKLALEKKFSKMILNSRSTAVDFYLKLGFKKVSEEYISPRTKLPHYKMEKNIV